MASGKVAAWRRTCGIRRTEQDGRQALATRDANALKGYGNKYLLDWCGFL
jgi:hypothetical protein